MSNIDLVIVADGSFDGSDATAGVGFQVHGDGFFYESGAAFDRQVCRSSVEAEIAAMIRGLIVTYRILAKNLEGYSASRVTVRCDCDSAVRFMNGIHIKGVSPALQGLRTRVADWYRGDGYELRFTHLKAPTGRNLREITPAQYVLMDVDKVAKTYAGYHRFSRDRVLQEDLTFAEDFKLETRAPNPNKLRKLATC